MDMKEYNEIVSQIRKNLVGKALDIPYYFQLDSDGFLDRECHNCGYLFKISGDAWATLNGIQYCPLCKFQGDKEAFFTKEQEVKRQEQFDTSVREALGNEITIQLDDLYSRKEIQNPYEIEGFPFTSEFIPEKVKELSKIQIVCDNCNVKYAIFGSAYFCPNCGSHSFEKIFNSSVIKIDVKLEFASRLDSGDGVEDDDIVVARSLIETSLNDCVITFQFNMESIFKSRYPGISISFNLFQRIDDGNKFWKQHQSIGYTDILSPSEIDRLKLYFQKRHLLSHTDGIVDAKYIQNSNDTSYSVGQRIVIKKNDVEDCLSLIKKIASEI